MFSRAATSRHIGQTLQKCIGEYLWLRRHASIIWHFRPCRALTLLSSGDLNNTLANPVLLIAETYDPATPLRNGRRLSAEMGTNARLIVHHGYGHSSRDRSNCTDSIAQEYILNGTIPEEQETACFANEKPYLYGVKKDALAFGTEVVSRDPIEDWDEHIRELSQWHPWLLR